MLNVIHALFFRELKTRFGANRHLGYLWVVGEPMSITLAITVIVTIIREYYHQVMPEGISIFMFLTSGIMPYFMFRSIVTQLMNGTQANLALFAYKPVKPIHVFIARTLLEFCIYFVIFITVLFLRDGFLDLMYFLFIYLEFYFVFFYLCAQLLLWGFVLLLFGIL